MTYNSDTKNYGAIRGFTVLEILIVAAVSVVITVVVAASLLGQKNTTAINNAVREAATTLREAQSRSISQEGGVVWGVHFDNNSSTPFFALFQGSYPAGVVGSYGLPSNVQFSSSSIASGGSLEITFAKGSGAPSTSTSLSMNLTSGGTVTTPANISRTSSGKIFFDDFNRSNL
ncbi:MAG: hypothetical protein KGJ89_03600 [Patescibacteria group bacterium]|nr:hypothetical protein [Patescibacteria group bacterium]MDE2015368.1 hypothetical protein [Patescibacteria group bacterium]MDE2227017.1 hypothetical protein [Patescibacteria group bacterium]